MRRPQADGAAAAAVRALAAVAMLVLGSACAGPNSTNSANNPTGPAPAVSDAPLGVAQVLAQAASLHGRTLRVTGTYAGWTGPCRGAPPRTRSDWMLAEGAACLYVTGPVPAGIRPPPDTVSNGRTVQFEARLERADDGRPYLVVLPH